MPQDFWIWLDPPPPLWKIPKIKLHFFTASLTVLTLTVVTVTLMTITVVTLLSDCLEDVGIDLPPSTITLLGQSCSFFQFLLLLLLYILANIQRLCH